jgi:tetratricopeptide (TPR) repeat protein
VRHGELALQSISAEGDRLGGANVESVQDRLYLAWALAHQGDFQKALGCNERARAIAQVTGRPWDDLEAYAALGFVRLIQGEGAEALRAFQRAREHCDLIPIWRPWILAGMGRARILATQPAGAAENLRQAVEEVERYQIVGVHAERLTWLAEAQLALGEIDAAADTVRRAQELARRCGERGHEAESLLVTAALQARTSTSDAAYREALKMASELGMRPLVAHCHLGLGQLYSRTGDAAKATEHLTTATTMYREMGMTFWLEKTEVALKEAGK